MHSHDHSLETRGNTLPFVAYFYDAMVAVLSLGRERRFREATLDLAEIEAGQHILDVGCGTGTLALLAKLRVGSGGRVSGIDATPQMIDRARRKAARRGIDVAFEAALIESLPFPDETFDIVLSTLMMHHLPDDLKSRGLQEIRRVLRSDGRLLIVDLGEGGHGLASTIHGEEARAAGGELKHLVEEAGFQDIQSGQTMIKSMIYVKGFKAA